MDLVDLSRRVIQHSSFHASVSVQIISCLRVMALLMSWTDNFFQAWSSLGVSTPKDPSDGFAGGAFWAPSSLDPKDETRSYARTAHYDRVIGSRPNYHLLTDTAMSKIIFSGTTAVGVEYLTRGTNQTGTMNATKEVVLAAGSVHTPQILQLSGIGPESLLKPLGIDTLVDLPGVGQNFQDHPTLYASYNCK